MAEHKRMQRQARGGHVVQRLGFRISRGWAAALLVLGAFVAAAFLIGPLRPLPAELQVVALAPEGPTNTLVASPQRDSASGRVRFAVPLALRNVGARSARPQQLMLSVPSYLRLATSAGPATGLVTTGIPLRRYDFAMGTAPIRADSVIHPLTGVDTLWIEPDLPSYYCTAQAGAVPEFVPAPPRNPDILSDVRIFYSVRTHRIEERHSGLLAVRIDPAALDVKPSPMPPSFPTRFGNPDVDEPEVGRVRPAGVRSSHCGDPEQPMQLRTLTFETGTGGRVFVVNVQDQPRKRLYDLNRDSVIELESWDIDGDGRFDAQREARFPVPEFLMPEPSRVPNATRPDTMPPDSIWLAMFHATNRGPARFTEPLPEPVVAVVDTATAVTDSARPAGAATDTAARPANATDTVAAATEEANPDVVAGVAEPARRTRPILPSDTAGVVRRPPRAFLWLFNDTSGGPFRFSNRTAMDSAAVRAAADSVRIARQTRLRRQEPLGTPIQYPRAPRRDAPRN